MIISIYSEETKDASPSPRSFNVSIRPVFSATEVTRAMPFACLLVVVLCVSCFGECVLDLYLAAFLVAKLVCLGPMALEWCRVTTSRQYEIQTWGCQTSPLTRLSLPFLFSFALGLPFLAMAVRN